LGYSRIIIHIHKYLIDSCPNVERLIDGIRHVDSKTEILLTEMQLVFRITELTGGHGCGEKKSIFHTIVLIEMNFKDTHLGLFVSEAGN
jgi:hypothetical protein